MAQSRRSLALLGARLLDPASGRDEKGGLLVIDGRIAEVGPTVRGNSLPEGCEVIRCEGHCLAPGLVDMRVQLREPGEEHMETTASGAEAAAAGGVTSMVCLPNTNPIVDDVAAVEFIARRARETRRAKVYCYGAVTQGLLGKDLVEMGLLAESGALAFTDGLQAVADARVMRRALSYAKAFGKRIIQHPEEPRLAEGGMINAGDYRTFAKLSPPLRSETDRRAVAAAVADGTIDCVASDHAPYDQESKRVPFNHAAPGILGLETLLPLTLELYHKGEATLIDLLRRMTVAPADLLDLPQGRLAKGAPADLLLFDPDRPGRIEVDRFRSKSKNSPFDGRPIQGRVLLSIVDGRTVFSAEA